MIFNSKLLFLHYPKTGGMMLTPQLLQRLKGKVNYTLPLSHLSQEEKAWCETNNINVIDGTRHENIEMAKSLLKKQPDLTAFNDYEKIIVLIRNPYDYIISRFHYLKENQNTNKGPAARIAAKGDFELYATTAPRFYQTEGYIMEDEGQIPENLVIIRFEAMSTQLNHIVKQYLKSPILFEKKVNYTKRKAVSHYVNTSEIEEAIYQKFKFLFDKGFYNRLIF